VKFKPAYFPFTEPSVEGYVYMEERGWVEVFGAGLFRPEILEVLGYSENVGAWGMGLERLAMKLIGVEDIRLFYSREIDVLRKHYSKALKALGE
jgi:phenylalanyl-tRNA synthetase alpha chain